MHLFITKFFKTTPESLVKELESANSVFNKAIERLKKTKLRSTTKMIKNNGKINELRSENEQLASFNMKVESQINKFKSFLS